MSKVKVLKCNACGTLSEATEAWSKIFIRIERGKEKGKLEKFDVCASCIPEGRNLQSLAEEMVKCCKG